MFTVIFYRVIVPHISTKLSFCHDILKISQTIYNNIILFLFGQLAYCRKRSYIISNVQSFILGGKEHKVYIKNKKNCLNSYLF